MKKKLKLPKEVKVRDEVYKVVLTKRMLMKDPMVIGYCDPEKRIIKISTTTSEDQQLKTFLHELFHAMEFEYDIEIKHKSIYKLAKATKRLIKDNF